jgi:hypothetical protein
VTADDLRELGVRVGHRRALLDFISLLRSDDAQSDEETDPVDFESDATKAQLVVDTPATLREPIAIPNEKLKMSHVAQPAMENKAGVRWYRLTGEAASLSEFTDITASLLERLDFPKSFHRFFADNKPMPFAILESASRSKTTSCVGILLRVPERDPRATKANTMATITNRVVLLAQFDGNDCNSGTLISYHKDSNPGTDAVRASPEQFAHHGVARLFLHMVRTSLAMYGPAMQTLTAGAERMETSTATPFVKRVERLTIIQKQAGVFKRCLASAAQAVEEMGQDSHLESATKELVDRMSTYRDVSDELESNAYNTVNLLMALDAFKGGQNLKIFTYLSFVLQPIATMTGWYGMNFTNMPDLGYENSYYVFIGIVGFIVLLVIAFLVWKG